MSIVDTWLDVPGKSTNRLERWDRSLGSRVEEVEDMEVEQVVRREKGRVARWSIVLLGGAARVQCRGHYWWYSIIVGSPGPAQALTRP